MSTFRARSTSVLPLLLRKRQLESAFDLSPPQSGLSANGPGSAIPGQRWAGCGSVDHDVRLSVMILQLTPEKLSVPKTPTICQIENAGANIGRSLFCSAICSASA